MAKGKNLNPADAYPDRSKARDFALVKKDTRDLEEEIEKLEAEPNGNKARLKEVKEELEKINKKKEDYVAEHPDHRKLVFRARRVESGREQEQDAPKPQKRNLFNKHGLPRHPERSIYYDPVMNPYGVPPPGMPYVERPLRPDEVDSGQEDNSDDDVVMPEGPPPGSEEVDSDDDIPMPEGPPPPRNEEAQRMCILYGSSIEYLHGTEPPLPPALPMPMPPLPPLPPGAPPMVSGIPPPPPPAGFPGVIPSLPPLPPAGFSAPIPPPPVGFPPFPPSPGFPGAMGNWMPPPPPGFIAQVMPPMPPPPPGFFPRRSQSQASKQDPLSSIPHQTYQAHQAAKSTTPAHPSLPPKPSAAVTSGSAPVSAAAVVSAEPELRDFKKEATAFVPASLKRKKAVTGAGAKVNAAPTVESGDEPGPAAAPRPDLLSTIRSQFGTKESAKDAAQDPKPKDDYTKFLDEMSDILGPQL
ncbi:hypothetical protein EIP86_004560 [Pleurotus ostreatoroseus]|nr:hypothetical protein EIP86_004560 [Pleurotus ostreatoroseus]